MRHRILTAALFVLVWSAQGAHAASFSVSSATEIGTALSQAQANGESDTVTIAAGTYNPATTLTYDATEAFDLTIVASGDVTLDGSDVNDTTGRILYLKTTGAGAAISVSGITFTNGFITSAGTELTGAGLFLKTQTGDITLSHCAFTDNRASALYSATHAAGAYVGNSSSGSITLDSCTFTGNYAKGIGGGLYISGGTGSTIVLTNNVFDDNTATTRGAGAYINLISGTATLTNNTVVNNVSTSGYGGGVNLSLYNDDATGRLYNNILYGNTAPGGQGADVYLEDDGNANGTPGTAEASHNDVTALDAAVGTNLTRTENINADPGLDRSYRIGLSSPCVEAGTSDAPSLPAYDFEGSPRIRGSAPDIGADECNTAIPALSPLGLLLLAGLLLVAGMRPRPAPHRP